MKRGQFKPVLMELKALFKKERCLIPQSHPVSEFEGKVLLGCELLRSYMRQKTKARRKESCKKFEYSDFTIRGLFEEKENRLLYGDFLELGFERGVMFVGEYQWRLTAERRVSGITG